MVVGHPEEMISHLETRAVESLSLDLQPLSDGWVLAVVETYVVAPSAEDSHETKAQEWAELQGTNAILVEAVELNECHEEVSSQE